MIALTALVGASACAGGSKGGGGGRASTHGSAAPAAPKVDPALLAAIEAAKEEERWLTFIVEMKTAPATIGLGWDKVSVDANAVWNQVITRRIELDAAAGPAGTPEAAAKAVAEWNSAAPGIRDQRRKLVREVAQNVIGVESPRALTVLGTPP